MGNCVNHRTTSTEFLDFAKLFGSGSGTARLVLQRGDRLVEQGLPSGEVHVRDVERLQLVVQLLGLRHGADGVLHLAGDVGAALL